jgi:7,8-dihydropterin-6-yl-methyl-4-(beta-D-ribofuranosyl)aminobenzene 5'-phosphate synthase
MGGLAYVLSVNPRVKIYAPKESFGVYGGDLPGTFYRRDPSLAPEQRYYDGAPPEVMRFGAAWPDANFQLVDKSTEIAPGIHLIALVSDKPGTLELRELSLVLNTPDGAVVVVGCAHPGIDRVMDAASKINSSIHLVAGGFHLVVAKDDEITTIVTALRDRYHVAYVAPGHCTGEPTFSALRKAFDERYLYAGLGTTLAIGSRPRPFADAGQPVATGMDDEDLQNYRAALAASDDDEHPLLAQDRQVRVQRIP